MRRVLTIVVLTLAWAAGCSANVDYIDVEPGVALVKQRNGVVWLRARAMSHAGVQYPQVTVSWSVKDPSVAQVDATGKVTPVKSGRTEVVAKVGSITATVPVEVLLAEKMRVEPNPVVLREHGEPVDLRVTVYDYRGRELRDRTATFHSLDPKVLTMGTNAAHPGMAGNTQVEVRVDELVDRVNVQVRRK
jgi:hypothetical protein